jgi:RNA polymerase sigma-70 factor (ECF subfamily)
MAGPETEFLESPHAGTPEAWVQEHGDCLFRYALFRVRRQEVAEDLVQDTLLAALKAQREFAGRSSLRSWLVGILRNKIFDHFRKQGREQSFTDLQFGGEGDSKYFNEDGGWKEEAAPKPWGVGEQVESLDKEAFWKVMGGCLDKMPKRVGDVFLLREMEERSTEEICKSLSVTPNNLWVMLHRARTALRQCLEVNWFEQEQA